MHHSTENEENGESHKEAEHWLAGDGYEGAVGLSQDNRILEKVDLKYHASKYTGL